MFDSIFAAFSEISREICTALFLWSWQAALLLAVTFLIAQLNRVRSAEIRHRIWLAGLSAVAVLPVWNLIARRFLVGSPAGALPKIENFPAALLLLANGNNHGEITNGGWFDWLAIAAAAAWAIVFVIYLIRFLVAHRTLRRLVRRAQPLTPVFYESPGAEETFLAIPENVALCRSPEISNPALTGFWRPIILFPANIEEWTSPAERRAIIRHELAHLERYDHFTQILQIIVKAAFFFHPIVRYALNQLNFERELACDEKVVGAGIPAHEYTEIILKVAEHDVQRRESLLLTFTPKQQLKRRIYKIMKNRHRSLSNRHRLLLLTTTAALLALVVWLATPNPISAQSSPIMLELRPASNVDDQTTESFKRLYESMKEAMLKGDKAAFESFFADDYEAVSMRGTMLNKQQVISTHIRKPTADTRLENVDYSDFQVKTSGETVIVTYAAEMSGSHNGAKFSHKARITDIWKKNGDKWQSIASHASNISQ